MLLKILKHNNISNDDIEKIQKSVNFQKEIFKNITQNYIFEDEISELSKEDFEKAPLSLFLADNFYEKKVYYNYEEYLEHLDLTKKYEKNNKNYKLSVNTNNAF